MFPIPTGELLWKPLAIALFAALLGASGYLGYRWYSTSEALLTAVTERQKAEHDRDTAKEEVGALRALVQQQNTAVTKAAEATARASSAYQDAVKRSADYSRQLAPLLAQINATKSADCGDALARQRRVIENLNAARKGPQ